MFNGTSFHSYMYVFYGPRCIIVATDNEEAIWHSLWHSSKPEISVSRTTYSVSAHAVVNCAAPEVRLIHPRVSPRHKPEITEAHGSQSRSSGLCSVCSTGTYKT